MNAHAIAGLVALNLWLLGVGIAVLFALRGWRSWGELVRLSGVAYIVGVAVNGVAWVWELVVGIDLGLAEIFVTGLAIAVVASLAGYRLGRRLPPRGGWPPVARLSALSAVFGGLTAVYLEALFRSGRLGGLYEFDAWAFWVPKAKAIYFFGGFDHQFFRELINQSYPPLVPALQAAAFHFMGAPDVVTVRLQYWFLFAGFVVAVLGLLSGRVNALFVWPPLLFVLVTPNLVGHALQAQADFPLDEFFAIAALLVALWLMERRDWQLVAASLLLAAAMTTKREGYAFAASVVVAALIVTWSERRAAWPKLVAAGVVAAAATVPWRIFLVVRGLNSGGPELSGTGLLSHGDRAWPSLRLALSTLFDYDLWLVVVPLGLVAVAAAFAAGARRLPAYVALVYVFMVAAFAYGTWAFPSLGFSRNPALNPIVRLTGGFILLTLVLVPLLLSRAWRGRQAPALGLERVVE